MDLLVRSMTHVLLLGAGFSRNWGGRLASEIFDSLIAFPEIRRDEYLLDLLWKSRNSGGFENALAELQSAFVRDPTRFEDRLNRLQSAVLGTLQLMNDAFFELEDIEFQQLQERMLRVFLFRFDAIFTLNQDILLEHHYLRHVELAGVNGWTGSQLPGMRRIPSENHLYDPSWGRDSWVPQDPTEFRIEDGLQPFFKLHGSSNWRDVQGGQLLVIGGNKSRTIDSHAVLAWSFDKFRECLTGPNTKLFVIGYGFRDSHVNEAIITAVRDHGLQFYVIDRLGSDVVRHANPSFGGDIYAPNELDEAFTSGLIGASERSLRETFGGDLVSHGDVMRFFD